MPLSVYTCPDTTCDNNPIEFDSEDKFCSICGAPLQWLTVPTDDNDPKDDELL